ncbi:MAG: class I SAM-dependent methyltransferase, partial [Pyrinomonadaceae bacterium]
PFDYPEDWVLTKMYSWNEVYALRAFLMYNSEFEIIYFNHFVAQKCKVLFRGLAPELAQRIMLNPGGGLWLRRV